MQHINTVDEPITIRESEITEINGVPTFAQKIYEAAKMYACNGIMVIPIRKNSKFLPEKSKNVNYSSASKKLNTIEKWFHPANGLFAGYNIGIPTGKEGGIFALDVDRHGEEDGFEFITKIEKEFGKIQAPYQETISNGRHYIFQWSENATSSTGKIAPGIDTRGGIENACKGHIVVWPSVINGNEYKWAGFGEVPIIPQWIMESLGVAWRPKTNTGRGNENVGNGDIESLVPITQLNAMLDSMDPDDMEYDEWVRTGKAINSQYPGEDGLVIWDEWSQRGRRYKKNECTLRWRGFDPAGPIRMGSLFYYAKEAGWVPGDGQPTNSGNKFDELVEKVNSDHALVVTGGKLRVLIEHEDGGNDIDPHYTLMGVNDFKTFSSNDRIMVDGKPIPVSSIWLAHEARREYRKGMGLFPECKVPHGYYNTWSGFAYESSPGTCGLFLQHVNNIICDGDPKLFDFVMAWCADLVQNPSDPKGTAIVMRGDEGTGKGTFANTIGSLFGHHYTHLIDDSHLTSNFNSHLMNSVVVFADEITWGGNKKTAGKLKGIVTEKVLVGERKGVDAITYRNMVHMMIASNSDWVIPAGSNSRRWLVLDVNDDKARNTNYFDDIANELNNGGREALLHVLLNMEINVDIRSALQTEALQDQRKMSMVTDDSTLSWWYGVVQEHDFGPMVENHWPDSVKKSTLHAIYSAYCEEKKTRPIHDNVFGKKLRTYGFKDIRVCEPGGRRVRSSVPPTIERAEKFLTSKFNLDFDNEDEENGIN